MNNVIFGVRVIKLDKLVVMKNSVVSKIKATFNTNPFSNDLEKIKTMKMNRSKRGR